MLVQQIMAGMSVLLIDGCTEGLTLETLPIAVYKEYSDLIDEGVYEAVDLLNCVCRRTSEGGTAPGSVRAQVAEVREVLKK